VYFIAAFGLLMMCLSVVMISSPNYWSDGILTFSKKPYFHWFEIITRLITGGIFVLFYQATLFPKLMLGVGIVLIAVSFGLLIAGATKHRQFAVWSARKFIRVFRFSGVCSFMFGIFIIYGSNVL
jgi:hypothetical protein